MVDRVGSLYIRGITEGWIGWGYREKDQKGECCFLIAKVNMALHRIENCNQTRIFNTNVKPVIPYAYET